MKVRKTPLCYILLADCLFLLARFSVAGAVQVELTPFNCDSSHCSEISICVVPFAGNDTLRFEFQNNSTVESSVAGVYFEKGSLSGITGFEFGPGTLFQEDANPARLPAGNLLQPPFDTACSARSVAPTYHNGIGPGEHLTVIFKLEEAAAFDNLLTQLESGHFRIGAHVIGLPDGSSFSAVTTPEPATILLLGFGCLILIRKDRVPGRSPND
ncbi:MAG: PEP-CTERM sorting domain-containing protein [Planctomycetota bacterium]|jgi:hypothetical protein